MPKVPEDVAKAGFHDLHLSKEWQRMKYKKYESRPAL